jgi:hypothetical protein
LTGHRVCPSARRDKADSECPNIRKYTNPTVVPFQFSLPIPNVGTN